MFCLFVYLYICLKGTVYINRHVHCIGRVNVPDLLLDRFVLISRFQNDSPNQERPFIVSFN